MSGFEKATAALNRLGLDREEKLLTKEAAEALEGDESVSGSSEAMETDYQLGFVEAGLNPLHHEEDWREWDGGKVGGAPVWLDPMNLPSPETLACSLCKEPMKFLLQIYCPLDDVEDAFHRTIYMFCCHRSSCVNEKGVLVLRSQLPKDNPYYVLNPGNKRAIEEQAAKREPISLPPLCSLCGCVGKMQCTKCKRVNYCSKSHQKIHWKHHKLTCGTDIKDFSTDEVKKSWLFKEYDLVVSEEELKADTTEAIESSTTIWEDARTTEGETKEEEDADLKLQQKDYDQALGNKSRDPEYLQFLSRVRRGGAKQVLRYCRWNDDSGPLAVSSAAAEQHRETTPPLCEHCGGLRKFEFQIMPQLLSYLQVDGDTLVNNPTVEQARMGVAMNAPKPADFSKVFVNQKDEDLDWGCIDIYTCTHSCMLNAGVGYAAEYARVTASGLQH
jgi:pre-rRNA-processing protein TSR4